MKVVILCGGKGTRLREETEFKPKPMVEIGGRPIVWHIMKFYASYGFNEFILCLGYKGNYIKEYFLNYDALNQDVTVSLGKDKHVELHGAHEEDFKVTLVDTGEDNMTGSRVKQIERYIDGDEFMVTYGDGLCDVDLNQLLAYHRKQGKAATVTAVQSTSRFGHVGIDNEGIVTSFAEKPTDKATINAGYFVFNKEVFNYIDNDPDSVLEVDVMKRITEDQQLAAHVHDGFFFAMDTYRENLYLNECWKKNDAPWATWRKTPALLK